MPVTYKTLCCEHIKGLKCCLSITVPTLRQAVEVSRRRNRNNQHYALICTTPLFYILASTRFGSSLPSLGSFLDPSELLEIQIEWVVYHIMLRWEAQQTEPQHSGTQAT
jgi:hypothetical protein